MRILYRDREDNSLHVASVVEIYPEAVSELQCNLVMCDPFDDGGYYIVKNVSWSWAEDKVRKIYETERLDLTNNEVIYECDEEDVNESESDSVKRATGTIVDIIQRAGGK